ncbi:MAG TPA: hypothetical protein VLC09_05420 [Polyangiaceae bacterium]|nr:hypothetical protein [Polyangiaceae bacterium]
MAADPQLSFGLPIDAFAWACLALGLLVLVAGRIPAWSRLGEFCARRSRLVVVAMALGAAALSLAYFHFYLGGVPRVIDATAYSLEARLLALGRFTFDVPEPTAAFRGRFLVGPDGEPWRLGVLFPPGYPLVLALGVKVGAAQLVGPALAAGLIVVTYLLALEVSGRREAALLAAAFGLLSAALRYHTADTMSHGWSALLSTTLLWLTLRAARAPPHAWREAALAGLCAAWLVATRPLTGLVVAFAAAATWLLTARTRRTTSLLPFALATLPPLLLLVLHQQATTGSLFGSPQLRYYELSDGPPGCFGLGLGTGCHFEHGPTVAQQGGGLGVPWMLRNTARRLHSHSLDLANFELLALLVPFFWWRTRQALPTRLFAITSLGLIAAYALFYFDGSYPGGGARFFIELLPLEHVTLAAGLWAWGGSRPRQAVAVSLLGFACHGGYSHEHLRSHMEGPGRLDLPSGTGVLFVESDHAFLAHFDPRALDHDGTDGPAWLIARRTDPLRDAALLAARSRSAKEPTERHPGPVDSYTRDRRPPHALHRYSPPSLVEQLGGSPWIIEAESEWPLRAPHHLWGHPSYPPGSCVSRGRGLLLHPTGAEPAFEFDATFVPRGRYAAEAVFWTAWRECFREPLGDWSSDSPLTVRWRDDSMDPRHLDRIELRPLAH